MSLNSYISSLGAEKWISFTDTPPTTGSVVNQGGSVANLTLRTSTSASTPTLISDGTGPDGSNFWRFSTTAASTAVTESVTGGFSALAATFADTDWVVGQWVRFNDLPITSTEASIGFLSWNTYSAGGFRLSLNANTATQPYRIRMQLASTVTVYSTDPVFSGIWYFIAVSRSGNTYTLYINGEAQASATGSTGTTANNFIWGQTSQTDSGYTFDMSYFVSAPTSVLTTSVMQNIVAERTYDKYKARLWNLDRTPVAYVPFDFKDVNGNYKTANKPDNQYFAGSQSTLLTGTNAKIGAGAAQVNASGILDGNSLAPSLGQSFTISFWFKRNGVPTDNLTNWMYWYSSSTSRIDTGKANIRTTGQLHFDPVIGGTSGTALYTQVNVCDNIWHHIVITRSLGTIKMFVDGVLKQTATNWPTTAMNVPSTFSISGTVGTALTSYDEFNILDTALSDAAVTSLYGTSINSVNVAYTDTSGATASATFPDATHTAETVINVTYTSDVLGTASAETIDPIVGVGINLDGGGVSTASAEMLDSTITTTKNVDYPADAQTASAISPNAVVAAQKFISYSASPATASALLSSNLFFGKTNQDTLYDISLRQLYSFSANNNDAKNGTAYIGVQYGINGAVVNYNYLALKENSGLALNNEIVKVKFDTNHVTLSGFNGGGGFKVNVYVFTSNPSSGTFETMSAAQMGTKELIYQKRLIDDGSTTNIDLTPAFADSRAKTYGILLEMDPWWNDSGTNPPTDTFKRIEIIGTDKDSKAFYVLSSDSLDKNINADIMTASANSVDASIYVERYVNFQDGVATASADIVHPAVSFEIAADIQSAPLLSSALAVQPAFSSTVEYPHAHAEAFATILNPTIEIEGYNNYIATVATASALFHMPQFDIGENNASDTMDASAIFVEPMLLLSRSVAAMVTTASTLMVNPVINSELLGAVIASPMTANAISPNPPAYLDLFGDPWYSALYAQHSVRHGLPAGFGTAFLKIFEDQNTDITQSTPNTVQAQNSFLGIPTLRDLRNNVTYGMYVNSGPENDGRYVNARAITDYSTPANESRMSVGYFDNWNRKAIRLQNIGFAVQGPSYSKADFSMEFSIKTTKANQVLAYGSWSSPTSSSTGNFKTTYNLVDGKLNVMTYGLYDILHPYSVKPVSEAAWNRTLLTNLTGNTRIDDGQWHHIVIQFVGGPEMDGGIVGRLQYWIDGNLDIQRFNQYTFDPDTMGANIENGTFATDFYTSAFSIDAPGTVAERDIDLHYYDFIKYEPIIAEPMTASLTMTPQNVGAGNRGRALMLYWWPTSSGQNQNQVTRKFDSPYQTTGYNEFDISMAPQELETIDYIGRPPQVYYGWDVFPVDINGYFVSDLVKEEAYGGAQNIAETTLGGAILTNTVGEKFKVNRRGYFRNTLDDTRRYIDLVNDIDLSQFDAIFFKNYPDQSNEVDAFARNEIVDPYFNLRETVIYENFIKSLRAAVDTGISLMVNNPQLALDLKIIDRIEVVPDLVDTSGYQSDPYTPTIVPSDAASLPVGTGETNNIWWDTYKNNRIRIVNTFPGITDNVCIIPVGLAFYNNDDSINYGAPSRPFMSWEYKQNGLSVGDEFYLSSARRDINISRNYLAVPIQNIKAGTPITAFANQYRKGLDLVDNPYKNHVTSIAIKPGDVLDGKQVGAKIWVNFTEPINRDEDFVSIDAIHTDWINLAFSDGQITETLKNTYLASPDLLETRLANGEITQQEYNKLSFWDSNGMYILTQTTKLEQDEGQASDFAGDSGRKLSIRKNRKVTNFRPNKTSVLGGVAGASMNITIQGQFFSFSYGRKYSQLLFVAESMQDKGFLWTSIREASIAQTQAHTAMTANATIIQPTIIGEKQVTINTQAMLANATKMPAIGYEGNDKNILSLPLEGSAVIVQPVKKVSAEPMTASAAFREQLVIRTTAQDQVVVYVLHEDPILYLREDIIK